MQRLLQTYDQAAFQKKLDDYLDKVAPVPYTKRLNEYLDRKIAAESKKPMTVTPLAFKIPYTGKNQLSQSSKTTTSEPEPFQIPPKEKKKGGLLRMTS